MLRVVDVSNNNGKVDFAKVKADGAVGVWLKVSEGLTFVDQNYAANYAAAKAAGLKVGGYHFGHPKNPAASELAFFLAHLKLEKGDLLPALDLEVEDGMIWSKIHTFGLDFLNGLRAKIRDIPVLYSGEFFMRSAGLDVSPFRKWVADYGATPVKYDAWQYTDGQTKYGPPIAGLDTSYVPDLSLMTYKAKKHKRGRGHVKKHVRRARARYVTIDGFFLRVGSVGYRWFMSNRKRIEGLLAKRKAKS